MKKVLNKNNQVVILQNSEKKEKDHKAILEYSHEDIGFCRLVFKYGAQVFVYQDGLFLYASEDEEPSHDLNHHKVIIDMEKPISPLQKAAYTDAKECKILLWQALGKEEPKDTTIPDHTPIYTDSLNIIEYINRIRKKMTINTVFVKEFINFVDSLDKNHARYSRMQIVKIKNEYNCWYMGRIIGFDGDLMHVAGIDLETGGHAYWCSVDPEKQEVLPVTIRDIINYSEFKDTVETYNVYGESEFYDSIKKDYKRIFDNSASKLYQNENIFISYCEGCIRKVEIKSNNCTAYADACKTFEKLDH